MALATKMKICLSLRSLVMVACNRLQITYQNSDDGGGCPARRIIHLRHVLQCLRVAPQSLRPVLCICCRWPRTDQQITESRQSILASSARSHHDSRMRTFQMGLSLVAVRTVVAVLFGMLHRSNRIRTAVANSGRQEWRMFRRGRLDRSRGAWRWRRLLTHEWTGEYLSLLSRTHFVGKLFAM